MSSGRVIPVLLVLLCLMSCSKEYDVIVVGGTPGGIMSAVSASRMGKSVLLLERTGNVGGLPANGLGATDIGTRGATTGLFLEFVERVRDHYVSEYGPDSPQVADCSGGYHFEPSVAEIVFSQMLSECKSVKVLTMRQFDSREENVEMDGGHLKGIRVLDRNDGKIEKYRGRMFIDATYEGDLGAAAGVPFRVGREGREEFGEPVAGKVYQYWGGPFAEGTTFEGDETIQAYNYRLCLTRDPANLVPFRKPLNYNREEYLSLIDDILYGYHTGVASRDIEPSMRVENRKVILAGGRTVIPGDPWGIAKLTNMVRLPNGKTDANNQHLAFISTDLPEENYSWPTASWEWRDAFAERLREYTEGLFWFASHDEAVPESFRSAVSAWGYAADEYTDNGNFPRQVYVREGRRFEGMYFFTANDSQPATAERGPVHRESVTASHYNLDSHAHHKREEGRAHLEGFYSYGTLVYNVPYGVIVPKEVSNLLLPVPVSGSHSGFSTLRMEPCWMALGQAAGTAAALALDGGTTVQQVDVPSLQDELLRQGATLVYLKGHSPSDPDFISLQKEALSKATITGGVE
ncbi:MAG: FAD-dependent oxidoreductase [Bacteroidales bacterium]|nr:FAD-dependent oxidoreductase [Bacteroidales bacterium]